MRVLIMSGGTPPTKALLARVLAEGVDLIIAADSGARALLAAGVAFDLALGDFDSLEAEHLDAIRSDREIITFPPQKDFSDTEAAVREAIRRGADQIVLLGATGTRLDHVLANLGVMLLGDELGAAVTLLDDHNELFLISGPCLIEPRERSYLSFFPVGGQVPDFSVGNVRYPLTGHLLAQDSSLTVSNEFLQGPAKVSFPAGRVLVVISRD